MQELNQYISEILGIELELDALPKSKVNNLPLYIKGAYKLYNTRLYNHSLVLAETRENNAFSNLQIEKHLEVLKKALKIKVVLVTEDMSAINRKRLIEKGINFIVPGKQLFLPDMLLDLRERFNNSRTRKNKVTLLPSVQYILLYHILHRDDEIKIEDLSFKELAERLSYTQMGISKAVENLKYHELCKVEGVKEKYMHFNYERSELWNIAIPLLVSPVLKRVYVDKKPDLPMLQSNIPALTEYSDIHAGRQIYYAIEKTMFYDLQRGDVLLNPNEYEGKYCLEVWKYNPEKLAEKITKEYNVDPLSLYLSLKESHDERIEMALDQIIRKYIW